MIEHKTIEEHISSMNQKIGRLETGGRMAQRAQVTPIEELFTVVSEGNSGRITIPLAWDDPDEEKQPHGLLYWDLYVGSGTGENNLWPTGNEFGVSVTDVKVWDDLIPTIAEPNKTHVTFVIFNNHIPVGPPEEFDYRLRYRWVYLTGQTAAA